MEPNGGLDPSIIGRRLLEARRGRAVTQEDAARHLGCSRPTLIAIEKGERSAKPEEIIALAQYYGRSVNEIVRPGAATGSLVPHLRIAAKAGRVVEKEINLAIAELQRFAEDYRQIEELAQSQLPQNFPPQVSMPKHGPVEFAEIVAGRERARLGLGDQPVLNLRQILEADVGLRVFYAAIPSRIAGLYAYSADFGYCILINRKHPGARRRLTLAHEYWHFLTDRHKPGIDYVSTAGRRPLSERCADAFAASFLMPASGVHRQFQETIASQGDFFPADLCRMSNYYFVAVQAMTLRLEKLGLLPAGTWENLKEHGFEVRKARQHLSIASEPYEAEDCVSERYKLLVAKALVSGEISEGQAARFLRCDRIGVRETLQRCRLQTFLDDMSGELHEREVRLDDSSLVKTGTK